MNVTLGSDMKMGQANIWKIKNKVHMVCDIMG